MKKYGGLRITHSYVKYESEVERERAREEAATRIYKVLSKDNFINKKDDDLYINVGRSS